MPLDPLLFGPHLPHVNLRPWRMLSSYSIWSTSVPLIQRVPFGPGKNPNETEQEEGETVMNSHRPVGEERVRGDFSSLSSSLSASNKSTSHWGFPSLFLSQWSPFVLRAWGFRSWGAFLIYLPFVFNLRFGLKYGQLSLILYLWVWCWMLRLC